MVLENATSGSLKVLEFQYQYSGNPVWWFTVKYHLVITFSAVAVDCRRSVVFHLFL